MRISAGVGFLLHIRSSGKIDVIISPTFLFLSLFFSISIKYRHYKEEAEIASMTWKIQWSDIVLSCGERAGGARGGKFGSRLSIGRGSIAVSLFIKLI